MVEGGGGGTMRSRRYFVGTLWEALSLSLLLTVHPLASGLAWQGSGPGLRGGGGLYLVMCKSKNPTVGGSNGMESPSNEIDASHWSIHLIECSTSSFLICLIGLLVLLYLFKKYNVCCFKSSSGPVVVEERRMQELGPGPAQSGGGFRPI